LFTLATGGILVAAVDPSSSAAAAGLAPGDVVTGISGSDISVMSHADALRVLQVLSYFAPLFAPDASDCRVPFFLQSRKPTLQRRVFCLRLSSRMLRPQCICLRRRQAPL
jgi:hypothetical protein